MRVAGIGFRRAADIAALRAALAAAGGLGELCALATTTDKAAAPVLARLARELGLPVLGIPPAALAGRATPTRSPRILARLATGSLAEAAALVAAGTGGRLLGPRALSPDRSATAAIATIAERILP